MKKMRLKMYGCFAYRLFYHTVKPRKIQVLVASKISVFISFFLLLAMFSLLVKESSSSLFESHLQIEFYEIIPVFTVHFSEIMNTKEFPL